LICRWERRSSAKPRLTFASISLMTAIRWCSSAFIYAPVDRMPVRRHILRGWRRISRQKEVSGRFSSRAQWERSYVIQGSPASETEAEDLPEQIQLWWLFFADKGSKLRVLRPPSLPPRFWNQGKARPGRARSYTTVYRPHFWNQGKAHNASGEALGSSTLRLHKPHEHSPRPQRLARRNFCHCLRAFKILCRSRHKNLLTARMSRDKSAGCCHLWVGEQQDSIAAVCTRLSAWIWSQGLKKPRLLLAIDPGNYWLNRKNCCVLEIRLVTAFLQSMMTGPGETVVQTAGGTRLVVDCKVNPV